MTARRVKRNFDIFEIASRTDPVAIPNAKQVLKGVTFAEDAWGAVEGADALVLATEWNEFRRLDFPRLKRHLKRPIVIDCKNIYDPVAMNQMGFTYVGVGRGVPLTNSNHKGDN